MLEVFLAARIRFVMAWQAPEWLLLFAGGRTAVQTDGAAANENSRPRMVAGSPAVFSDC